MRTCILVDFTQLRVPAACCIVSIGLCLDSLDFPHQRSKLDYCAVCPGNPNMVMALAGNKAGLEDKRKVTVEASTFSPTIVSEWVLYVLLALLHFVLM